MTATTASPAAPRTAAPSAFIPRGVDAPSTLLSPPPTPPAAPVGPTPRAFLAGFAQLLGVSLLGLAALLTGWGLTAAHGWPAAAAAVAGWSLALALWLLRRGWPAATAHLAAWAAPAALQAPLAGLGRLSADGLILWGPASAVLAVALAAVRDPSLACRPPRARRTR
jgi:hypothetical protein